MLSHFDCYKLLQYHQFKSGQLTQLMHQTNKRIKQTNKWLEVHEGINAPWQNVYKCCNGTLDQAPKMERTKYLRPRDLLRSKLANGEIWWDTGLGRAEGTWLVSVGHAIKDAVSFTSPGYHICIFSYCNFNHISCNLISSTLFNTWISPLGFGSGFDMD